MTGWWTNWDSPVVRLPSAVLVSQLREKPQEAFVPLSFPPGDAMQIDWGEATVYLSGEKTVVKLILRPALLQRGTVGSGLPKAE